MDRILKATSSRSAVIFLCSRSGRTPWVEYLLTRGLSAQASQDYADRQLHRCDPFLSLPAQRGGAPDPGLMLVDGLDRDLTGSRGTEAYWNFVRRHELGLPGAFVRQLPRDMMLVFGLHGRSGASPSALSAVAEDAAGLIDAIMAEMLFLALKRIDLSQLIAGDSLTATDSAAPDFALSGREREIIDLLSQGLRNKQIAYELAISENTVETHLRRIYSKLGVNNRTSLMHRVMNRQGMFRA